MIDLGGNAGALISLSRSILSILILSCGCSFVGVTGMSGNRELLEKAEGTEVGMRGAGRGTIGEKEDGESRIGVNVLLVSSIDTDCCGDCGCCGSAGSGCAGGLFRFGRGGSLGGSALRTSSDYNLKF